MLTLLFSMLFSVFQVSADDTDAILQAARAACKDKKYSRDGVDRCIEAYSQMAEAKAKEKALDPDEPVKPPKPCGKKEVEKKCNTAYDNARTAFVMHSADIELRDGAAKTCLVDCTFKTTWVKEELTSCSADARREVEQLLKKNKETCSAPKEDGKDKTTADSDSGPDAAQPEENALAQGTAGEDNTAPSTCPEGQRRARGGTGRCVAVLNHNSAEQPRTVTEPYVVERSGSGCPAGTRISSSNTQVCMGEREIPVGIESCTVARDSQECQRQLKIGAKRTRNAIETAQEASKDALRDNAKTCNNWNGPLFLGSIAQGACEVVQNTYRGVFGTANTSEEVVGRVDPTVEPVFPLDRPARLRRGDPAGRRPTRPVADVTPPPAQNPVTPNPTTPTVTQQPIPTSSSPETPVSEAPVQQQSQQPPIQAAGGAGAGGGAAAPLNNAMMMGPQSQSSWGGNENSGGNGSETTSGRNGRATVDSGSKSLSASALKSLENTEGIGSVSGAYTGNGNNRIGSDAARGASPSGGMMGGGSGGMGAMAVASGPSRPMDEREERNKPQLRVGDQGYFAAPGSQFGGGGSRGPASQSAGMKGKKVLRGQPRFVRPGTGNCPEGDMQCVVRQMRQSQQNKDSWWTLGSRGGRLPADVGSGHHDVFKDVFQFYNTIQLDHEGFIAP